MAKRPPPNRLFKNNADHASRYVVDRSSKARLKSISRQYEDVLNAIETALVASRRSMPQVDDHLADLSLSFALHGGEPDDPAVKSIAEAITLARPRERDVTDVIWRECLRVVQDSVRRHSGREPGQVDYFDFVAGYIK